MTAIPHDPFTEKGNYAPDGSGGIKLINVNGTSRFQYKCFSWGSLESQEQPYYLTCKNRGYIWALGSRGPARSVVSPKNSTAYLACPDILSNTAPDYLYDPSNGTVSFGWILRTNKGVTTGGDWAK